MVECWAKYRATQARARAALLKHDTLGIPQCSAHGPSVRKGLLIIHVSRDHREHHRGVAFAATSTERRGDVTGAHDSPAGTGTPNAKQAPGYPLASVCTIVSRIEQLRLE
jgi:hypothetical protein